jgi:hypothetical protein
LDKHPYVFSFLRSTGKAPIQYSNCHSEFLMDSIVQYCVGDRILCKIATNSAVEVLATVVKKREDGTYDVNYEENESKCFAEICVHPSRFRHLSKREKHSIDVKTFSIGDRVKFIPDSTYSGEISFGYIRRLGRHGDNTFDVEFDDGISQLSIPATNLRKKIVSQVRIRQAKYAQLILDALELRKAATITDLKLLVNTSSLSAKAKIEFDDFYEEVVVRSPSRDAFMFAKRLKQAIAIASTNSSAAETPEKVCSAFMADQMKQILAKNSESSVMGFEYMLHEIAVSIRSGACPKGVEETSYIEFVARTFTEAVARRESLQDVIARLSESISGSGHDSASAKEYEAFDGDYDVEEDFDDEIEFAGNAVKIPLSAKLSFQEIFQSMHAIELPKDRVETWPYKDAAGDRGVAEVSFIRRKLQASIQEGRALLSTPDAIKCTLLTYVDLILSEKNEQSASNSTSKYSGLAADQIKGILKLFRGNFEINGVAMKQGAAIIDEFDSVLHPLRSELNFPIKEKKELDLGSKRWQIQISLVETIIKVAERAKTYLQNPPANDIFIAKDSDRLDVHHAVNRLIATVIEGVNSNFTLLSPHILILRSDWYQAKMAPDLAVVALDWLYQQQSEYRLQDSIRSWTSALHEEEGAAARPSRRTPEEMLIQFLTSPPGSSSSRLIEDYDYITQSITAHFSESIGILNLIQSIICSVLPHVLSKTNCVHYGLLRLSFDGLRSPDTGKVESASRALLAVPYTGKDTPSQVSEFAAADIRITMTVFAYKYQGMRVCDVANLVRELKNGLQSNSGPVRERSEYKVFQSWLQLAKESGPAAAAAAALVIPPLDLFPVGDLDMLVNLCEAIGRVSPAVAYHLENYAFKKTSTSQIEQVNEVLYSILFYYITLHYA